jgi:hypothetical protein
MDVRTLFLRISEQLIGEFRKTADITHPGGKGALREDAFRDFLAKHLPSRFAVGQGEVISSENEASGQLDIVFYDRTNCPALLVNTSHSVFPVESVFGAISMKSHLDSKELAAAYDNIVHLKRMAPQQGFEYEAAPGMVAGLWSPFLVSGIVAYSANRSLDAIAKQVRDLDAALDDITLRPDFVSVIGLGIIGYRHSLRDRFNKKHFPSNREDLTSVRTTGRHTLFRLYMQIVRELSAITLRPLDLRAYEDIPRLVGKYRVRGHDIFVVERDGEPRPDTASRLSEQCIQRIVNESNKSTLGEVHMHAYGALKGRPPDDEVWKEVVFEYNPTNLPPLDLKNIDVSYTSDGRPPIKQRFFQPHELEIDGVRYAVDLSCLSDTDMEQNPDLTADELFSR